MEGASVVTTLRNGDVAVPVAPAAPAATVTGATGLPRTGERSASRTEMYLIGSGVKGWEICRAASCRCKGLDSAIRALGIV